MLEPGDILNRDGTNIALWVSRSGMPPDAVLEIALPVDYARLSLGQLLDAVFPEDEADQLVVEGMLDVAENPDLPDIYDCFLPVIDQHRSGLCYLKLTAGGGRGGRTFRHCRRPLATRPGRFPNRFGGHSGPFGP